MSKSAVLFLILTVLAVALLWLDPLPGSELRNLFKVAGGLCASLFVLALLAGRRIKFDPQLR
ncbi:hypothetical protein JQX08_17780 [Pseudomonas sp. UL073]|uniref:Uncharacterized protein n=1 Tax=Zestomonas insulae TaxID=2809017 RepID=A0ABS2IHZ2_9GAMM|nr:PA3371 family protein [Pseudomonas insulae]MBM7062567.1 hypothetical protein [Pseudomonas insulae]